MPQGGNLDREYIQPVVEIVAKQTLRHHLFQIPVRCCYQTEVCANRSTASESLKFVLLQSPQEFRLELKREIADFVKKKSSPVCQLKTADILRDCPGKSAPLIAKKFTLQ